MIGTKISTAGARAALATLKERILEGADRALENVAAAGEKAARATTKFKDGPRDGKHQNLRDSIEHRLLPGYRARVIATAPHALFVEEDTAPHTITATNAPYLVFRVGGAWVRKKSVKHPGTKGAHFMRDMRDMMQPILLETVTRTTNTAIARHNR